MKNGTRHKVVAGCVVWRALRSIDRNAVVHFSFRFRHDDLRKGTFLPREIGQWGDPDHDGDSMDDISCFPKHWRTRSPHGLPGAISKNCSQ